VRITHGIVAWNRSNTLLSPRNDRNDRCTGSCAAWALAAVALLLMTLTACKPRPAARVAVPSAIAPAGATAYRVDGSASSLRFYLHADGPMASVGHAHVISAHELEGEVWLQPQPEQSTCQLRLPVAAFIVDDPEERAAAGNEYAEPLDTSAREGTRTHMLGERQLDAAHFPSIALRCVRMTPTSAGMSLQVAVTLRDRETLLTVPLQWEYQDGSLRASGEFSFRQSELGLEPYSLLLGALRVADEVHARFELVARKS
jgi:polyisoprenoid-binding protein YceI